MVMLHTFFFFWQKAYYFIYLFIYWQKARDNVKSPSNKMFFGVLNYSSIQGNNEAQREFFF